MQTKHLKLSPLALLVITTALSSHSVNAVDCQNSTITEGFSYRNTSFLSDSCIYNFKDESTTRTEISLENNQVSFNNDTIVGKLSTTNSIVEIKNSSISYPNSSRERLIRAFDSILDITNTSLLQSFNSSNYYSTISLGNSTLSLNDSSLTMSGNDTLISASESTITITNSTLSHSKESANTSRFVNSLISLENSEISLQDSLVTSEKGDVLFRVNDANVSVNNSTLNANNNTNSTLFFEGDDSRKGNNITIKDSKLNANYGFLSVGRVKNEGLNVQIENSTINTKILREEGRWWYPENNQLKAVNSTLFGSINDRKISVSLNDSNWTYESDSNKTIKNLSGNNATISIVKSDQFSDLIVLNDLSGNLHFELNTDLANEKSDKIVVKGEDSGNFTLGIKDSGNEPKVANGKVTLVETQTGQAKFSLKDKDYVDAGAYRYRLSQDGTNWILSNRAGETNTQPEPVSEPEPPVEQPAVETPVAETVEQPVIETPVAETVKQPVVEIPVAETVEQPAVETPAAETVEQPTVETLVPVVVAPVIPAVVESITNDKPSEQPAMAVLSEKSNALVSLRQAQGLLISQNLQGIHQRLGELKTDKTSHIWVKNINGRTNAKAQNVAVDSRSSGFEMDYHNLQIGADRAVSENVRLGGFVGTSRADVDFNGEYGKGKLRSQAVGLYGTFANENGWYWDNVAKYERLTAQSASLDKRKYNAFSLSSEIGKQIAFGNQWTLTPQAQLAYHSISSTADEDRLSLFSVRTGLRLAKGIELGNWKLQPYAEVNGIFENTHDAKVRVNQYQFDVPKSKNRVQTALGLTAGNSSHHLGLELSQTHGKQVRQPFNLLANYRYQW